jgi:hypothetical protein
VLTTPGAFTGWRILAGRPGTSQLDPWTRTHPGQLAGLEQARAAHTSRQPLRHTDLRAGNLLLTSEHVMVID